MHEQIFVVANRRFLVANLGDCTIEYLWLATDAINCAFSHHELQWMNEMDQFSPCVSCDLEELHTT